MSQAIYEKLYDFLVFTEGEKMTRIAGFSPADSIILDDITEIAKRKISAKVLILDAGEISHDEGITAIFTLDADGEPKSVEIVKQ